MPRHRSNDAAANFAAPPSFMGVPFSRDLAGSKAAILGVPFDCGTHAVRIGSRLGPNAIREQSALVRPYEPPLQDFNPLERLNLVDCGNVRVIPGNIDASYPAIEAAVWSIVDAGAVPVTMGGDGAVTLPQLRALHRKYPDLGLLHIDAHTDTYPTEGYNAATTFTRAAEEGLLDTAHSLHIGARGPVYMPEVLEHTRQHGYRLVTGGDLLARGIPSVLEEVHATLEGRPVYLCFDMDFFDSSCAPGVCTPAWGGASAREGLALLQGLAGLRLVTCDVNTVSPPHDVGGMTAFLAATVMLECLFLICRSLDSAPPSS
jgi:agmatinase